MRFIFGLFLVFLLLSGCLSPPECPTNECLESAFLECRKASGIWEGENRNIEVDILGPDGDFCRIAVGIPDSNSDLSGNSMECSVPMEKDIDFSINDGCQGSLVGFYDE